ncbi:hypothetical protein B0H17DRAFT_1135769 [Mycena rosella]|uniref:Uncharacterized protein n=1 Tax=Mycena rosella TaxID=1033263 RepID=A0AAD7DCK9_MYCRO|nr:hypothetical protein B0H17DRAFT_1135769 [Mycena rosella]
MDIDGSTSPHPRDLDVPVGALDSLGDLCDQNMDVDADHWFATSHSESTFDSDSAPESEFEELPDVDEWKAFDEAEDNEIPISREEMIQELEDMLGPDEEAELWDCRNQVLTEKDRDNIRAFRLKILSNMPREHSELDACRFCHESRLNAASKPRRLFCYIPIIPRLQGLFMDPKKVEQLLYRHNYKHVPGTVADVFDGIHYQTLRTRKVGVNGEELSHCYFSGKYDIALGVCTDSYLIFERRRKDAHSYLKPLDDELALLARGIPTYNALIRDMFDLRAYNLYGHEKIYYMPLAKPSDDGELRESWDPRDLPQRTDQSFSDVIQQIDDAVLLGDKEKLAKYHGIKGLPALRQVGSIAIDRARLYPWDCMHLFFENNIPNLIKHWTGKFKGLDAGFWAEIWQETAEAMKDMPSDFCRSLAAGPSKFTAEAWCFWFVYMAPGLLKGRFSNPKYHVHACELGEIIKSCLQWSITHAQIDTLEEDIVVWVETYEKYYYQYREDRLYIRFCGPSWTTWTFFMEHYCGFLKHGLRSKRFPWANLNNCTLNYAYMEQIGVRYDLSDELSIFGLRSSAPTQSEHVYEHYPQAILRVPYQKKHKPENDIRKKIARYFCDVLGQPLNRVLPLLPEIMPSWGKFEIEVKKRVPPQNTMSWVQQLCYRRLDQILECQLPTGNLWGAFSGQIRLLAVLTPCSTSGKDATQEMVTYTQTNSQIVTDLQSVSAVIGQIKTRGKWVIIDRTGGLIKPEFVPVAEMEEEEPGVNSTTFASLPSPAPG